MIFCKISLPMSEKSMLPSRPLCCIIVFSIFILTLSSLFLFQFRDSSYEPLSFSNLTLVNSVPTKFMPNARSDQTEHAPFSSGLSSVSLEQSDVTPVSSTFSESVASVEGIGSRCSPNNALIKVYVYELPPEFHFGLLGWIGGPNQTWPNVSNPSGIPPYPGGLNLQHSIEYWLTLDLLSSTNLDIERPCTAIMVQSSDEADVIFVPFFSSLSYNRHSKPHGKEKVSVNRRLQDRLVEFLNGRPEWKRFDGRDHLIVAHHPNSMLNVRKKLGNARFVLADFGRYPAEIANIEKDVIAPYKHVVRTVEPAKSAPFEERPVLVYFQGAIFRKDGGAIRQQLYYLLKDEKDVHFKFGSIQAHGISKAAQGMASSKFCLNIAGDTPSSNRLFDAIASHCVPVIISDDIELPYEDVLDYTEFCIFVRGSDSVKKGYLLNLLRGITRDRWTKMWERLKEVERHFEYQYPSKQGDAVDMIWQAVSRKVTPLENKANRKNRYQTSRL